MGRLAPQMPFEATYMTRLIGEDDWVHPTCAFSSDGYEINFKLCNPPKLTFPESNVVHVINRVVIQDTHEFSRVNPLLVRELVWHTMNTASIHFSQTPSVVTWHFHTPVCFCEHEDVVKVELFYNL